MATIAETRYAASGSVHVAYQVLGDAPLDLVLVPDGLIPMEAMREEPSLSRFLDRLSSFSRVILFDRRGTGLSDPVAWTPTLTSWMDDVHAVLGAAGSRHAALMGLSEGGFLVTQFAAAHPERASALVLVNATPGISSPPFSELGDAGAAVRRRALSVDESWGADIVDGIESFAPSAATNQRYRDWLSRAARRAASPSVARRLFSVLYLSDIRGILAGVRVPTLVVHRRGDKYMTPEHGRYLGEHIPGARYVEVAGADHVPYLGDADAVLDEVEDFLTGARHGRERDRVVATILFTDIVASTTRAATLGDRSWHELLGRYRDLVRDELARFRGREVDTAGDGFLVTFDGPASAIRCACAIVRVARTLELETRVGVHTGECEVSPEGVTGLAVHIGARVMAKALAGEVLVSGTVRDLMTRSGMVFAPRGRHRLKGVPGEWRLFAVEAA